MSSRLCSLPPLLCFFAGSLLAACLPDRVEPEPLETGTSLRADAGGDGGAGPIVVVGMDAGLEVEPPPLPAVEGETGRLVGITAAHNAARARVSASPPLAPLSWSPRVAQVAQRYAEKLAATCAPELVHSSLEERMRFGENLGLFALTNGGPSDVSGSARRIVELWESELQCYTYGPFAPGVNATCSEACGGFGGCGHYTQMVWRTTTQVGCGVADCTVGRTRRSFWVCHYDPTGNYLGLLPY